MEVLVRRLTRADVAQYAALDAFAFQGDEKETRRTWTASPPFGLGAFSSERGRLLAALQIWPFLSFFQGRPMPAGGIAAVASWPEVRRQGLVARLLRESLAVMREEGQVVSLLYPFSYPFYRRYGWELGFARTQYEIPLAELEPYRRPPNGSFRPAEPDDLPALDALYRRFISRWNGPLLRESTWWRDRVFYRTGAPGKTARRAILLEDGPRLQAYVVYGFHSPPGVSGLDAPSGRILQVFDWAVEDGAALRSLLSFLVQHDSMAGRLALPGPPDWDLLPLLVNPRVEVRRAAGAMIRIVDMDRFLSWIVPAGVQAAAAGAAPDAFPSPAVQIQVSDDLAPWNEGSWLLSLTGGGARRLPAKAPARARKPEHPILRGTIQVWSQVLSGYLPTLQAWHLGLLELEDTQNGASPSVDPSTSPDPEDPLGTDRPLRHSERLLQAIDDFLALRATYLPDSF